MEFWLILFSVIVIHWAYPYVRCFAKRISMYHRLMRICKRKGYRVHGTHPLWWLGHKRGRACDFYIETPIHILSVKLFGLRRRTDTLVFTKDGCWLLRHFIAFASQILLRIPIEGRKHKLPAYDFRHRFRMEWEIKSPKNILLIHPTCLEIIRQPIHGAEVILGSGDVVNGAEIYSMSRLLGLLEGGLAS